MFVLLFFLGVLTVTQFPALPSTWWLLGIFPCTLLLFTKYRILAALFLGFLWALAHASFFFANGLSEDLENQKLLVQGVVSSLPEKDNKKLRFNFDIDHSETDAGAVRGPGRIRLSWYNSAPEIKAGERWQFYIKVRRINGMMNPGGFDYERWAFEQVIHASAYVIKSDNNKRLAAAPFYSINAFREALKQRVMQSLDDQSYRGLVLALLLGDRAEINEQQWEVLTITGTNHLVAISGLHIGLVAGAVYFLGRFMARRTKLILYFPAPKAAAVLALAAAFFYAMLAGFAIPTQRALAMIAVVMLCLLWNKKIATMRILLAALLVVMLIDPFAVLSAGFWLSFGAVAAILFTMQSRWQAKGWWWKWGRIQWIVAVALVPILIVSFQQFSIISPLANFVAVPWVSILVVPVVLVGGLLSFTPSVADFLFVIADYLLAILWWFLQFCAELPYAYMNWHEPIAISILLAVVAVILFLSPRGLSARYLAVPLCLPLVFVQPEPIKNGEIHFTLLDVGQGLSAVVRTTNHLLVFDTGPRFSEAFDTGKAVVWPFLRATGAKAIDTLVISHGDNDHIGGMESLLAKMPVNAVLSGDTHKTSQHNAVQCLAGQAWQWDGVRFEILHPNKAPGNDVKNNDSCVLKVSSKTHSLLLSGDIEKKAEKELLEANVSLKSDVVIVPHHGSNTSSSRQFIAAVAPKVALYPAGYANRYGFPKAQVVERYDVQNITQYSTGNSGAISIKFANSGDFSISEYRVDNKRFWNRPASYQ